MNTVMLAQLQQVIRHVEHVLGDPSPFAEDIAHLRRFFATNPQSYTIDFERYARSFAAGFFVKNYWHASCLFLRAASHLQTDVLDWGGGSGATTLAYLTALQLGCANQSRLAVKVTLLDTSPAQLDLAKAILAGSVGLFPDLDVQFSIQQHSLSDWHPEHGAYGAVLFGHVLTESETLVETALVRSVEALAPGGSAFVIEDSSYPVWRQIGGVVGGLAVPRLTYRTTIDDLRELPAKDTEGNENLSTSCLVLSPLRALHGCRLLSLYFQAWREQNVELLDSVFTADAWYIDNSIPLSLHGLDSIREYWHEHVLVQTDFALEILRVFEHGNDVVFEWSASFNSPVHGGPVRFDGAILITIDTSCGKISTLTEYVNRLPR